MVMSSTYLFQTYRNHTGIDKICSYRKIEIKKKKANKIKPKRGRWKKKIFFVRQDFFVRQLVDSAMLNK
jgi:hypothetical protein